MTTGKKLIRRRLYDQPPGQALVQKVLKEAVKVLAVEALAVEVLAVEVPAVEVPAVEAPAVEVPAVEAPKVKAPKVNAPEVKAPAVEAMEIKGVYGAFRDRIHRNHLVEVGVKLQWIHYVAKRGLFQALRHRWKDQTMSVLHLSSQSFRRFFRNPYFILKILAIQMI